MCRTLGNAWLCSRAYPSVLGFNSASDAPCAAYSRLPRMSSQHWLCSTHPTWFLPAIFLAQFPPAVHTWATWMRFADHTWLWQVLLGGCAIGCQGGGSGAQGWGWEPLVGGVCCGARIGTSAEALWSAAFGESAIHHSDVNGLPVSHAHRVRHHVVQKGLFMVVAHQPSMLT